MNSDGRLFREEKYRSHWKFSTIGDSVINFPQVLNSPYSLLVPTHFLEVPKFATHPDPLPQLFIQKSAGVVHMWYKRLNKIWNCQTSPSSFVDEWVLQETSFVKRRRSWDSYSNKWHSKSNGIQSAFAHHQAGFEVVHFSPPRSSIWPGAFEAPPEIITMHTITKKSMMVNVTSFYCSTTS